MIADAFKVVLEAEVDDSKLNRAGSKMGQAISKSFESHTKGMGKMFKNGIGKATEGLPGAKGISTMNMGNLGESLKKNVTATQKMGKGMIGKLGGILSMITKFIPVIAFLAIIGSILKGLAPIVGLIKLIVAMIQLTLYPILQFFLIIFKPILYLLLKYLIIPFYQTVMPVMQKFDKWLMGNIIKEGDKPEIGSKEWHEGIVAPWQKIIDWVKDKWPTIKEKVTKSLQKIIDWVKDKWPTIKESIEDPLQNIINWVNSTWRNITGNTKNPLQNIINWVNSTWQNIKESITNPLKSIFDFISKIKLPSWLGGGSIGGGSSSGGSGGGDSGGGSGGNWPITPAPGLFKPPGFKPPGGGYGGDPFDPNPPRAQEGAIAMYPQTVKVAEREPEIIIPLRKLERVKLPSDMSKGNTTINFNIQKIEKDVDMDRLVDKLESILYSNNKRTGAF